MFDPGGPVVGGGVIGRTATPLGGSLPVTAGTRRPGGGAAATGGRPAATGGRPAPIAGPTAASPPPPAMLQIPYGVRVPTFVVSPWTIRGRGPSLALDHCSILKTVLARFLGSEKPFLSDRVSASHSFDAFLTEAAPRTVPDFKDDAPDWAAARRPQGAEPNDPDYHQAAVTKGNARGAGRLSRTVGALGAPARPVAIGDQNAVNEGNRIAPEK